MALNPNQKFQQHFEKRRHEHQPSMQMGWGTQHASGSFESSWRTGCARVSSFVTTFAATELLFGVLLGGLGFLIARLVGGDEQSALVGAALGVFVSVALALSASYRAAAV